MEGLDIDSSILSPQEVENLFVDSYLETQETPPEESEKKDSKETETTEVNPETLFTEESEESEKPESVGSEDNKEEKEDTASDKGGTSPKNNFYSSIAKAFVEDGVFPDLNDDEISKIESPEDFRKAIVDLIQAGLDERQKRVNEALNVGIEANQIRQYENTIDYLESIQEEAISDEGEKGETLRKQLIFLDFYNRGYSKERAQKEVEKSFNAGTDIDDAKDALKSNKEFFSSQYQSIIDEAKKELEEEVKERKALADKLKKSILEDKKFFGEIEVDNSTRKKIFDNISKPVYKDPETGDLYSAIQKYEMDNRTEFLKNVGLLFTLTNGFKDIDRLVNSKVNKEKKRGIRELEHTLANTARTSDGGLDFSSGVSSDPESYWSKGYSLDI